MTTLPNEGNFFIVIICSLNKLYVNVAIYNLLCCIWNTGMRPTDWALLFQSRRESVTPALGCKQLSAEAVCVAYALACSQVLEHSRKMHRLIRILIRNVCQNFSSRKPARKLTSRWTTFSSTTAASTSTSASLSQKLNGKEKVT